MQIIDGRKLRDSILEKVKEEILKFSFQPVFCDVLVGDNPVSAQYVRMKARKAEKVGIKFHGANFSADITTEDLVKEIKILNKFPNMCGIIIQLPLPINIDRKQVLDAVDPALDVECLGQVAGEEFYKGNMILCPPTALACMALLDSVGLDFTGKKIVIVGKGDLVGKPVNKLFNMRELYPEIISSDTEGEEEIIKQADIIISGTGHGKLINGSMIKKGAVIIDAGTSEEGNSIVGDVDLDSVKDIAGFVSPVPGGVGPVTVAMLLKNVLTVAKTKNSPHPNPLLIKERE